MRQNIGVELEWREKQNRGEGSRGSRHMEGVRAGKLERDWQGRPELKFWSCKAQLEVVEGTVTVHSGDPGTSSSFIVS